METLPLSQQVKVFGGVIKFRIHPTNKTQTQEEREIADENIDSNSSKP